MMFTTLLSHDNMEEYNLELYKQGESHMEIVENLQQLFGAVCPPLSVPSAIFTPADGHLFPSCAQQ